jgi:hypothetical protein
LNFWLPIASYALLTDGIVNGEWLAIEKAERQSLASSKSAVGDIVMLTKMAKAISQPVQLSAITPLSASQGRGKGYRCWNYSSLSGRVTDWIVESPGLTSVISISLSNHERRVARVLSSNG